MQYLGEFHSRAKVIDIHSGQKNNDPVTGISKQDADWFCAWLIKWTLSHPEQKEVLYDYRLATEVEIDREGNQSLNFLKVICVQLSPPLSYDFLVKSLAIGDWYNADWETSKIMLEVMGKAEQDYLISEDVKNFPFEYFTVIDQLWLKFSGGHFGFTVQKSILQDLSGTDEEVWNQFFDLVGWRKERKMMDYSAFIWSLDAPRGHLPVKRINLKLSKNPELKAEYILALREYELNPTK